MTRLASRISPEIVAGLLSLIVLVAVIGVRSPAASTGTPGASGSPTASPQPTPSDALPPVVRSALETVIVVNGRLAASGQDLEGELGRPTPGAPEIAVLLPPITAQITGVAQAVTVLVADPATATLGSKLDTAYGTIVDLIRAAQRASVQNVAAYVKAGKDVAAQIRELAPLTARARAILAGTLESPSPAPTSSASSAPTGSPSGSGGPAPSRAGGSPTASPIEGGLIVDPGFEDGLGPWSLELVPPGAATLALDPADPGSGKSAARIDIATGTDARSGISLVQSGIGLRAGQTYTVRLLARAAQPRDLRIRLSATNGDAYVARIFPVGTTWGSISFTFDVLVDDSNAVLGIDLGRSTETTWLDAVALTPGG